eukprot:4995977-Ditylum_brightwellii.AAC.1
MIPDVVFNSALQSAKLDGDDFQAKSMLALKLTKKVLQGTGLHRPVQDTHMEIKILSSTVGIITYCTFTKL